MIREAIQTLVSGQSLTMEEAASVMEEMMQGDATPAQIAAFITALRIKGETVDEIVGLAKTMRAKAMRVVISEPLVDRIKGRDVQFGDENDVYVREVTRPVLCYYEPVKDFQKFPIQLLKPRAEDDTCS